MAIVFDTDLNSTAATAASTSLAHSTGATVAAGATIHLLVGWFHATGTLTSVTGGSLTWTIDKQIKNGSVGIALVSAYAAGGVASGTSLTANYSASSQNRGVSGWSFTGIATSSPVDTSASATGSSTAWTGGTCTTTAADTVVVGVAHGDAAIDLTSTPSATWTEVPPTAGDFNAVGNGATFTAVYKIVSSAGANTPGGSFSGSVTFAGVSAAYMQDSAVAVPPALVMAPRIPSY